MNEITKYIKKMLKDVGDMLDTMSMIENPKAVSALKASISGLLIAAGGLYAGTQIHQAVNPGVIEEPARIPSAVNPGVIEEPARIPSAVNPGVIEEPARYIPSNEPSQNADQTVEEKNPSEPSPIVDKEVFEHYKPGLSIGDSCDTTNKCSDKTRVTEELIDDEKNLYLIKKYGLQCPLGYSRKCEEKLISSTEIDKEVFEHYKPGLSIGDSCDTTNKCSDKTRVTEELIDAEKNLYLIKKYGLQCPLGYSRKCEEKLISSTEIDKEVFEHYKPGLSIGDSCDDKNKCSDKTRVVTERVWPLLLAAITTYKLLCKNSKCLEKRSKLEPDKTFYEYYKPGLSIGDSCDTTNKCSDKKRVVEIFPTSDKMSGPSAFSYESGTEIHKLHCYEKDSKCWEFLEEWINKPSRGQK